MLDIAVSDTSGRPHSDIGKIGLYITLHVTYLGNHVNPIFEVSGSNIHSRQLKAWMLEPETSLFVASFTYNHLFGQASTPRIRGTNL